MTSLASLIHRRPVILPENATVKEAAKAILDNRIGCILVCSPDGIPSGILTDRDLAIHWAEESPSAHEPISAIMSRDLVLADENAGLQEIIRLMESRGVRRIPLVQARRATQEKTGKLGRITGIVTLDDLIGGELIEPSRLARIIRRQVGRRVFEERRTTPRGQAHQIQTLQRYLSHIAASTGLPADLIPQVSHVILSSLVMRISMTGAAHFLAQLPELIRAPLMNLPTGPDKFITPQSITAELVERFHLTETYARPILHRFLAALSAWMTPGQIEHLCSQLPEAFLPLFEPVEVEHREEAEAPSFPQLLITSPSFSDGSEIPRIYTGDGFNRSPRLEWSKVPQGTREFALICEDPDATSGAPWVHWVIYGISGAITQIPEGIPQLDSIQVPIRARQGRNSEGRLGYQGPMPPPKDNWHRYYFRLFALNHEITLAPAATADELRDAMRNHIIGEGVLVGRYRRAERIAA